MRDKIPDDARQQTEIASILKTIRRNPKVDKKIWARSESICNSTEQDE